MVDGQLNKKIAFIIQARMQSKRLPGKVLQSLPFGSSETILSVLVKNLNGSTLNPTIFIATSSNQENDIIEDFCRENNIKCQRGSENDVLSRYIKICSTHEFDTIVRLTGDNPIIDVEILDQVILKHILNGNDYTGTKGLPLGMNLEIISNSAVLSLQNEILNESDKEHVTLYIRNNESNKYVTQNITLFEEYKYKNIRVTIDYPSDYLVVSTLFSIALQDKVKFGILLIEHALNKYAWLFNVNALNYQKQSYASLEDEKRVAIPLLKNLEFHRLAAKLEE